MGNNIYCNYCGSLGICIIPPNKKYSRWDCFGCGAILDKVDLKMYDSGQFHASNDLIPQFPNNRDYMEGFESKKFEIHYKENLNEF